MSGEPARRSLDDPVELLMPEATKGGQAVVRKLATALRLAALETADARSPSAGVELGLAFAALREHDLIEALLALEDLLIHHAAACRRPSSFAVLPKPRVTYTESLRSLLKLVGRRAADLEFELSPPGTPPEVALRGLLQVLKLWVQRPDVDPLLADRADLWEARCLRYDGAFGRAQELLGEVLAARAGASDRVSRDFRAVVLAELVSIHLDQGQLDEASAAVARGGPSPKFPADVRDGLGALALAVRWLQGEGTLPSLRDAFLRSSHDVPHGWSEVMSRTAPQGGVAPDAAVQVEASGHAPPRASLPTRAELGAQALVFLVLDDEGRLRRGTAEVSPALEGSLDDWVRRGRRGDGEHGLLQQEALRGACPVIVTAGAPGGVADGRLRRSCLDPDRGLPLGVIALPIEQGDEVVGLLWMEFATRLLPGAGVLRSIAERAVGHPLLRHRVGASVHLSVERSSPLDVEERAARDDLRRLWVDLVEDLSLKTAERRWVAFQRFGLGGDLVPVASGGAGGRRLKEPTSRGVWAIRRVLGAGGFVRYEGDPGQGGAAMLHPGAAAGVAIAVPGLSGVEAVLVIESARRGDSRERDATRWAEMLERKAGTLQCAALDLRDRMSHGGGLVLDSLASDEQAFLVRLQALSSNRSDLIIRGEAGSGRRTLARAVHHARRARGQRADLVQVSSFGLPVEELREVFSRAAVETVVLADVERLDVKGQVCLTQILEESIHRRPRMVATGAFATTNPGDGVGRGEAAGACAKPLLTPQRHPDLYRNLDRIEVATRSLRHVRHRVPAMARALAQRWERSARPGDPMLWSGASDEVESILWRQPWRGNAVELEAVVRQALLRAAGAAVREGHLRQAFDDVGLDVVTRLPSRHPEVRDLASALWTTRTSTGRINKTRAAAYCGWDPNTLAARLRELGITGIQDVERLLLETAS
ncbi:MAG: hypothetical protein P8M11_01865 [Planctomycetota bacterium]|nr:hypothetical protein [Planctomycetota bacterium]MDG1983291.1 hypothetical protein [Planctomycetota bacterium]